MSSVIHVLENVEMENIFYCDEIIFFVDLEMKHKVLTFSVSHIITV